MTTLDPLLVVYLLLLVGRRCAVLGHDVDVLLGLLGAEDLGVVGLGNDERPVLDGRVYLLLQLREQGLHASALRLLKLILWAQLLQSVRFVS